MEEEKELTKVDEIQKDKKTRALGLRQCVTLAGLHGDGGRVGDDEGGRDTEGGEDESVRVATVCYSGWSPWRWRKRRRWRKSRRWRKRRR
jgi:hypothetical protein